MPKPMNLVGEKYGRLLVLSEAERLKKYERRFLCRCDCGTEKIVPLNSLRSGKAKSCGCYNRERVKQSNTIDISGKRYKRAVAIESTGEMKNGTFVWRFKCDCGNIFTGNVRDFNSGDIGSCGCLKRDNAYKMQANVQMQIKKYGANPNIMKNKRRKDSKSKNKGVQTITLKNKQKRYRPYISINGRTKMLGTFKSLEEAQYVRLQAERRYYQPVFIRYKQSISKVFTVENGIAAHPLLQGGWHYSAFYRSNGKTIYIGRFTTLERAIESRDAHVLALSKKDAAPTIQKEKAIKKVAAFKIKEIEDDILFDEIRKLVKKIKKRPAPYDYENAAIAIEKYGSWALFLRQAGIGWID